MPRTFLVKRNGEGETVLHSDSSESRDISISMHGQLQIAVDKSINSEMDMRPVGRNPDEAKHGPPLDSPDGDMDLYTEMEADPADGSSGTPHQYRERGDACCTDESKPAENLDKTNSNSSIKERTKSSDTTPGATKAKDEQKPDKNVTEKDINRSPSEQDACKNGRSPELLNLSGGESTAVVLTKALKTLVSNDYDVVTPPRQPIKKTDQDPVEKKITLFRPYDLDNKSTSSDKSRLATTESPMLLRSNYSNTERESSWCIEKHSKSESADNQLTAAMTKATDKLSNSPKDSKISDNTSVFHNSNIGIFSKLSDSEKMKSENTKLKLSLKTSAPTNTFALPVMAQEVRDSQKHPSLPAHMFKPLKSSTPKKPVASSLETDGTAADSQWSFTDTSQEMHSKDSDGFVAQPNDDMPPFVMPYQLSTNNDSSSYIHSSQMHQNHHIANIYSDNGQFRKSVCDENQNRYSATLQKEPLTAHARYESADGHRLPLKHSYKHQPYVAEFPKHSYKHPSYVAEPPDRGRPSQQNADREMGLKTRIRPSSCPPIPTEYNIVASIVGVSGIGSYPLENDSIVSSRGVVDAVKETWATYSSVMTSKMPSDDNYKRALPSFSTFSNIPLHRRIYSEVESQLPKSQDYRKNLEDVPVSKSGKHSRSKSESMIKSATYVTDNSYIQGTEQSRSTENHGLGGHRISATAKGVNLNMCSTEPSRFVVPVSVYRNECVPHIEDRHGGSSNKTQIAKCRTWHVPKHAPSASESLNIVRTQYPQNDQLNIGRKHDRIYSSQIIPQEMPYYSGNLCPRQVTNVVSSQTGNAGAFPDPKITLQYLDHQRKLIANATKSKAGQGVSNEKYLKPEMDLYKESHRSYQSHLPYPCITPPAIIPDTQVFTKPVLNPSHMFAPVPSPRFSKDPYVGQMTSNLEPSALPGHIVPHAAPEPRSAQLLRPSLSDVRRPLGTSTLQNKSPAPSPQPDPKIPLAAVLLMMKSQSQGSSIEMINGGYGIKNPTYTAPKVQDFPESEKAPTKFVCKFCQKEFNLQRLLNRHLKCHSDTKRYLCTFCGKGFNDTFDLKRHTRIHTGVKPYKCPSCDKAFTQRCSLESHSRKVHGIELPFGYKQRRTKMYVCEDCGHSTADPDQHFRHLQQNHPFCAALTRCHDKRQFKFKTEPQDDDGSVSFEGQGQSQGDSVSNTNMTSDENSSSSILGNTDIAINPAISDFEMNKSENDNIMERNKDQMMRVNVDIQNPYSSQTISKRPILAEVGASSPKKMKLNQSPKKTNVRRSPMKNRLGGTRSDGGFVSPKFDIENIMSQNTSVNGSKKLPLGCSSENYVGVQNTEHGNMGVDKEKIFERSNIPMVPKQPLGNTTQNTQW